MRAFYVVCITMVLGLVADCKPKTMDPELLERIKKYVDDEDWNPTYDSLQTVNVFGDGSINLEKRIYNSMQATANFFGQMKNPLNYQSLVLKTAAFVPKNLILQAAKFIPYASQVLGLVEGFTGLFTVESDWKSEFAKKFASLMPEVQAKVKANDIGHFLETVKDYIPLINATIYNNTMLNQSNRNRRQQRKRKIEHPKHMRQRNQKFKKGKTNQDQMDFLLNEVKSLKQKTSSLQNQLDAKTGADPTTVLHVFFNDYINLFAQQTGDFRLKYPLLGAPVIIELSLMLAVFEPLAMQLNENFMSNLKLSCKLRDVLKNFVPFVVAARLEATSANFTNRIRVRNAKFNRNGYNKTSFLPCPKFPCTTLLKDIDDDLFNKLCFFDKMSKTEYVRFEDYLGDKHDCEIGYAQHVRHLVEKMFQQPIDLLAQQCKRPRGKPTGELSISV